MPAAPKRDMMRYEILGYYFFGSLRIFYVEMDTSGGGGLHIRSWETTLFRALRDKPSYSGILQKMIGGSLQP